MEKWRRKAFELTDQLIVMQAEHKKDCNNFRAMEMAALKQIEDGKNRIKAAEQENHRLEDEKKQLESEIAVGQPHVDSLRSKFRKAKEECIAVIQVARKHRMYRGAERCIKKGCDGLASRSVSLHSFKWPKHPDSLANLESKVRRLSQKLRDRQNEKEENLASVSIFQKFAVAQKKYHQLYAQLQGIAEDMKRSSSERRKEQELRYHLSELQQIGQRQVAKQEAKMRSVYEAKKLEKEKVLRRKALLMNEIEELRSAVDIAKGGLARDLIERENTIIQQKAEMEALRERISLLENSLRFDKEVACSLAEEERPRPVELQSPRRPAEFPGQSQVKIDAIARLQELMQAAQQTAREHNHGGTNLL
jgi:chromosome segregation ATPase